MSIQRFRFDGVDLVQNPDGYWVRYDDHAAEVERLTEALTVDHLRVALACIEAIHGEEPRWDAGAAKAIRRAIEATEGEHA